MKPYTLYEALQDAPNPDVDNTPDDYEPYDMRRYDTVGMAILLSIGVIVVFIACHEFIRYSARIWGWNW